MSVMGALLLAWMLLSIGWAEDPEVARGEALRYALNLIAAADRLQRRAAARARGRGARGLRRRARCSSALYAIATRETGDGFARISGLAGTANELASLLVTALLLAVGLMLGLRRAPLLRAGLPRRRR